MKEKAKKQSAKKPSVNRAARSLKNGKKAGAENSVITARKRGRGNPEKIRPYRFQPGQSGNPGGRPKRQPITEALIAALDSDPSLARKIAINALKRARYNARFFAEVRDMLDGKPGQTIKHEGAKEAPLEVHLNVEFFDDPEKEKPVHNS